MSGRRGSVLIIVAGLAMVILALTVAYLSVVRADVTEVKAVSRDAQARAMLHAALAYVAESSRIGWSTVGTTQTALPNRFAAETAGWNDIRNGAIGPIPRHVLLAPGVVEREPQAQGFNPSTGDSTYRVGRGTGRWPEPGTAVRQSMYAWQRPPYAVNLAGNPLVIHDSATDVPPSGGYHFSNYATARDIRGINVPYGTGLVGNTGEPVHGYTNGNFWGVLWRFTAQPRPDPSPVATVLADFNAGDPTPRAGGRVAWFRVYRERPDEHDGNGDPWYDTVNLNGDGSVPPNASVFVLTCGVGSTQGFRNWAEVVSELGVANATMLFGSESAFNDRRREEVILWYRAEWTALTQQNLAPWGALSFHYTHGSNNAFLSSLGDTRGSVEVQPTFKTDGGGNLRHFERNVMPVRMPASLPFGSFLWLQALDREPPTW